MNEYLKGLYQRKAKIYRDLNDMRSRTRKEGKLSVEDKEQFDKWNVEFDEIDNQITIEEKVLNLENQKLEKFEEVKREEPVPVAKQYEKAFEKYYRFGITSLSQEENQILASGYQSMQERAATASSTTVGTGGYTIPEGFSGELERAMAFMGPFADPAGPYRPINTASGNDIPWPTIDDTSNEGYLLTESTDAQTSSTGFTFSELTLKSYVYNSSLVPVTIQLLQDSAFQFGGVVGSLLGERLGRKKNSICTTGTGSSQPQGVAYGATQGKYAASSTAFTHNEMIDLMASVDKAYHYGAKAGWMMHQAIEAEVKKLDASTSNYTQSIWQPSFAAGVPQTILGYPYWINNAMDSAMTTGKKVMLFGNFDKFVIRQVGGVNMFRFDERFMEYLQVAFMGWIRIDSRIIQSGAIKYLDLT